MFRQRVRLTLHIVGSILRYLSLSYTIPLLVALYYGEDWHIFLYSLLLTLAIGLSLELGFKTAREIERADGFSIVSFAWLIIPLLGAAPYMFLGWNFIDAFFEAMSGFTTTGATILGKVEVLPKSALLWRSLTQWLGGMGVIGLLVAILPKLGVGGSQLFVREFPGPMLEKLRPRIRTTAKLLWEIYAGFTFAEIALLYFLAKLPFFDSACISLCTLPTGGFTPTTTSIAAYANPLAEYIIIAFMIAAGTNFVIHYQVLRGNFKMLKDEEFRLYLLFLILGASLLTFSQGISSYRDSLFQAVSIMTTTGFATCNFGLWHPGARMVLLALMLIGGCGGSTGGAIKVIRISTLLKHSRMMMRKAISPKAVMPVKYNQKPLSDEIIRDIISFLFLYLIVAAMASITLGLMGFGIETSLSAIAATLGNVGPGLSAVGPALNYAWFPAAGKMLLIICMWLGRLEIFTVLMIFLPRFWRR
ncbi:MAG: TrkH family potassium uptake protein [Dehalococcoidia bacterium]|nr:TrkH family potassium uptake protein [Dehalococcoidia bacterium]